MPTVNHNGIIEPNEYTVGDSAIYVGQASPKYQMNLNTNVTLLNGRLSINGTFAYQNGMTQNNLSALQSGGISLLPNAPGTSLGTQAAFFAAQCSVQVYLVLGILDGCIGTPIGMMQTVNTFRFNDLSINYTLPTALSRLMHVPRASIALQGNNLGLHTNYRGKDPNVNAFSTVRWRRPDRRSGPASTATYLVAQTELGELNNAQEAIQDAISQRSALLLSSVECLASVLV